MDRLYMKCRPDTWPDRRINVVQRTIGRQMSLNGATPTRAVCWNPHLSLRGNPQSVIFEGFSEIPKGLTFS